MFWKIFSVVSVAFGLICLIFYLIDDIFLAAIINVIICWIAFLIITVIKNPLSIIADGYEDKDGFHYIKPKDYDSE